MRDMNTLVTCASCAEDEDALVERYEEILDEKVAEGVLDANDSVYRQFKELKAKVLQLEVERAALCKQNEVLSAQVEARRVALDILELLLEADQIPTSIQ